MPTEYPTDLIQPMGEHNPEFPCVRSEHFKDYLDIKYDHLNPCQSIFVPYLKDYETNIVLAAPTSSGKTLCAELFAAEAIEERNEKVLYIAPMKALADEKYEEWTSPNHTFSKYKTAILTGDFEITESRKKLLEEANIIVLTPEMFNSKCRFYENHTWLHNSCFIGDEIHLIGMKDRGDALEAGLIRYFEHDSKARALFISATIPNVDDFKLWLEHMTGRSTVVIKSNYRPCKLNQSFVEVEDRGAYGRAASYYDIEGNRMETTIKLITKYKKDPILVFVGNKDFGNKIVRSLKSIGIEAHFHNADLDREKRKKVEKGFRDLDYNVLISTTTNAWGVNLPARYVIISHTAFGITPMDPANIIQSMGRAGRAGYHPEGDALILVPRKKKREEMTRINSNYKVRSTLNDINILCFHILSYIVTGEIKTKEDLLEWYHLTLSSVQKDQIDETNAKKVLDNLAGRSMIKKNENDEYEATKLGLITAKMYMSPLDVSDWFRNFAKIKFLNPPKGESETAKSRRINLLVSLAFAECFQFGRTWAKTFDGKDIKIINKKVYISKREQECSAVQEIARLLGVNDITTQPHIKYAAVFNRLLNGEDVDPALNSYSFGITKDIERIIQTMRLADDNLGKFANAQQKCNGFGWGEEWDLLLSRIKYGVSHEMLDLVKVDGIGKKFAQKLYGAGIKDISDLKNPTNKKEVLGILGQKRYDKMILS